MENTLEKYVEMVKVARKLVKNGFDSCDPVVRSVYRKAMHFWKQMSIEDKGVADLELFVDYSNLVIEAYV